LCSQRIVTALFGKAMNFGHQHMSSKVPSRMFRTFFTVIAVVVACCSSSKSTVSIQPDSGGAGDGEGGDGAVYGPSCAGLTAACGLTNDECCLSLLVPGGTFDRDNDTEFSATVGDFYLDKYEVTVGRFRAFVNAGMGTKASPPPEGAGANPLIMGTGWDSTWNSNLVDDTPTLEAVLQCDPMFQTWTNTPGANEDLPINCVDWYEAFGFCAWDGGRLATEAEWGYAAAGGREGRRYPWGPTIPGPNPSLAIYGCYYDGTGTCIGVTNIARVGSAAAGNGKWGQSDLAGNVWEWVFDGFSSPIIVPCNNCAETTSVYYRVYRGGSFSNDASTLQLTYRLANAPATRGNYLGIRCARTQ
jgi:formylglycine-generating enzyme required for sulfatase activity